MGQLRRASQASDELGSPAEPSGLSVHYLFAAGPDGLETISVGIRQNIGNELNQVWIEVNFPDTISRYEQN